MKAAPSCLACELILCHVREMIYNDLHSELHLLARYLGALTFTLATRARSPPHLLQLPLATHAWFQKGGSALRDTEASAQAAKNSRRHVLTYGGTPLCACEAWALSTQPLHDTVICRRKHRRRKPQEPQSQKTQKDEQGHSGTVYPHQTRRFPTHH